MATRNLRQRTDNFLSNRTQQTRLGASLFDMISLASGIVQGSVIGPLLLFTVIGPLLLLLFVKDVGDLLRCDR